MTSTFWQWLASSLAVLAAVDLAMPEVKMSITAGCPPAWWEEGFEENLISETCPPCRQARNHTTVCELRTMHLSHRAVDTTSIDRAARSNGDDLWWLALPASDLELEIIADGTLYPCAPGKPTTQNAILELSASNRFLSQVWANRGWMIRDEKEHLGGKATAPWMVQFGIRSQGADSPPVDPTLSPEVIHLGTNHCVDGTHKDILRPVSVTDCADPAAIAWRLTWTVAAASSPQHVQRWGLA